MLTKTMATLLISAGLMVSSGASATIYDFFEADPGGSNGAGDIKNFSATYNNVTEDISWSTTVERSGGNLANGFWLVLSDGENPKNDVNEYAILYGDGINGNLTAYVYNGANSSSSWSNPGELVQSFTLGVLGINDVSANEREFSFSFNASTINSHDPDNALNATDDWDGIAFGPEIGIWFHTLVFAGSGPSYDSNGGLTSFPVGPSGWYDAKNLETSVVPVPAAVWLFGSALIGLVGFGKRRKAV